MSWGRRFPRRKRMVRKIGLHLTVGQAAEYRFGQQVYLSKSFVDKIEINLANMSSSPDDEFALIAVYYDHNEFTCELCGHQHCNYAFVIKDLHTGIQKVIGSECITHFVGTGIDIDLAQGLMKRVEKATRQAREEVVKGLGQKAWDALSDDDKSVFQYTRKEKIIELGKEAFRTLPKAEKSMIIIDAYNVVQAQELLLDVAVNKHILSEEEIQKIVDMGLGDRLAQLQEAKAG